MAGMWRKTLVYLGLAEEDEMEEYAYEDLEPEPARPARRSFDAEPRAHRRDQVVRAMPEPEPSARFHLVQPGAFNDAQEVGDKFRDGFSVIMNLQGVDAVLRRRLIDFASGLAYGLGGSMQPAADNVFLVTPNGVEWLSTPQRELWLVE